MKDMTREEARAFLRKVVGRPTRELEGKEKEQILLLLAMMEPFKETNNQHSWTEYYMIGNQEYHVTNFGPAGGGILELILDEDET